MSAPKFAIYPGLGEWAKDNLHYSQAVRLGNIIKISGQGQSKHLSSFDFIDQQFTPNSHLQAAGTHPPTFPLPRPGYLKTSIPRSTRLSRTSIWP